MVQSGQTLMSADNLLPSRSSSGRRLIPSKSLREHSVVSGQGLHTAGSSSGLAPLTSTSSSLDSAQELSEKVWGVLVEGLQPFMQWELQSGMGDFWEQVGFLLVTSVPAMSRFMTCQDEVSVYVCLCLCAACCCLCAVRQ